MAQPILKRGAKGPAVTTLQQTLNTRLQPSPKLATDGDFGGLTQMAVLRFQREQWLVEDGAVGPCTRNALMGAEAYTPILHDVPFIPQPTQSTCWAASTAMMNRSNVATVIARTPSSLLLADGSLNNDSDSNDGVTKAAHYARLHNLRLNAPMSWMLSALLGRLRHGPLMFDMLWDADGYVKGIGSAGHMIVVVGARGDDDPSGVGTTLRIHDPWEPNKGKRYSVGYLKWMQEVPTRTYHVFEKL